ncbi:hypothetical protein T11_9401 [Trichinella zimbabwensis]|uniref:Uncharacterized protein n=1 Tax=Trichinella zimbabwensis TaxID=268475 RepID=A0A0V1GWV7_9BILA|nr:hypothetical protein T11_9401 [Trichinella zimbabwensis]
MIGCLDSGGRVDRLRRLPILSRPSWSRNGSNSLTRSAESDLTPNPFTWTSLSHLTSAFHISLTERFTSVVLSLAKLWQFWAKRKQYAVTRIKWVGLITWSTPLSSIWLVKTLTVFCSAVRCSLSSAIAAGSFGQFPLPCISHGGPCHQRAEFVSESSEQPRLGMSAGFSLVGQYLQHWGDTDSYISCTRFATKGFQRADAPLIHARATLLSLQQVISWIGSVNIFFNLANSNAVISSSRGRMIHFIGATRDFAITKFTAIWWFIDSTRIYAQASYAACDASPKMWSSILCTRFFGQCLELFEAAAPTFFDLWWYNGASQPSPVVHKRRNNIFFWPMNGAMYPNGSYSRAVRLNICLLKTPRVFPISFSPFVDTSSSGSASSNSTRLLVRFLRWNPPFLRNTGTLLMRSSTYILASVSFTVSSLSSGFSSACALRTLIARYGEHANPKHTRVSRHLRGGASDMQSRQRKWHASLSSARSPTCKYIFSMSTCTAILYCLKRSRMLTRSACRFGPVSK